MYYKNKASHMLCITVIRGATLKNTWETNVFGKSQDLTTRECGSPGKKLQELQEPNNSFCKIFHQNVCFLKVLSLILLLVF